MQPVQLPVIGGRYQLLEPLGQGGMGMVYKAYDRLTTHTVALKHVTAAAKDLQFGSKGVNNPNNTDTENALLGLALEFRTLAGLRHPNIVAVLDYGFDLTNEQERLPYFTMELIEGARTITDYGTSLDLRGKIRLLTGMLNALIYLHRRGIVHRDIKPGNVLVTRDGLTKVMDFGLALHQSQSITDVYQGAVGTLAYMAPEFFSDTPASIQSDLYAVGVVAYELLAGRHPYYSRNVVVMINSILGERPDFSPFDEALAEVLERMLAKQPADRYQSAEEALDALRAAVSEPVVDESPAVRESFLQAARFVGREAELNRLTNTLNTTLNQSISPTSPSTEHGVLSTEYRVLSTFLIGGESGVGKSRLVDELRTRALTNGVLVLRGQAVEGAAIPFQLWREAARHLVITSTITSRAASILKEAVPDIGTLLDHEVPDAPELAGSAGRERFTLVLADLLRQQTGPILMILEDLQWAGDDLETLQYLIRAGSQFPHVMIVATYRDDEQPRLPETLGIERTASPHLQVLKLERLDDDAIAELSAAMLGDSGRSPEVVELLKRETEGNTFFMVEVVRALAEDAGRLDDIGTMTLPANVISGGIQQVIRRRLARVPDWAQHFVKLAAVAGRQVDLKVHSTQYTVLSQPVSGSAGQQLSPSGQPLTDDARAVSVPSADHYVRGTQHATPGTEYRVLSTYLLACADAAVMEVVGEQWRFTHDKIRETVLADLTDTERKTLHRQIAQAIEAVYPNDRAQYEVLLDHWRTAEEVSKELTYILHVAERLVDYTAEYDRAQALLDRGLRLTENQPDADNQRVKLLYWLGMCDVRQAKTTTSAQYFEESLALAVRLNDRQGIAHAKVGLGTGAIRTHDYALARQTHQESLNIYREIGDLRGAARCLLNLGTVALWVNENEAARAYYEESLAICRQIGELRGQTINLINLARMYDSRTQPDQKRAILEQSLALSRDIGDRTATATNLYQLGDVYLEHHQNEEARAAYSEALHIQRETFNRFDIAYTLAGLANVECRAENYEQASAYSDESLRHARIVGDQRAVALALDAAGSIARGQKRYEDARHAYETSLDVMRQTGGKDITWKVLTHLVELADEQGDASTAQKYRDELDNL